VVPVSGSVCRCLRWYLQGLPDRLAVQCPLVADRSNAQSFSLLLVYRFHEPAPALVPFFTERFFNRHLGDDCTGGAGAVLMENLAESLSLAEAVRHHQIAALAVDLRKQHDLPVRRDTKPVRHR